MKNTYNVRGTNNNITGTAHDCAVAYILATYHDCRCAGIYRGADLAVEIRWLPGRGRMLTYTVHADHNDREVFERVAQTYLNGYFRPVTYTPEF